MKAGRVHLYGPPKVIVVEDIAQPAPGKGEILVRVMAAGVGPWYAWIAVEEQRRQRAVAAHSGSDVAGVVEAVGPDVEAWKSGDEVYGVTNKQFCGGYAEYAAASAGMVGSKAVRVRFVSAASAPVVAVAAWQMLFDYGRATAGQTVLIHGAAGNVGAYAVQLARNANLKVFAAAAVTDAQFVTRLGRRSGHRLSRFKI